MNVSSVVPVLRSVPRKSTAVYIVSDPRSMPGSKLGRLVAGLLAGILNAFIRWHGYLPEGIVPAVLAVNLLSPTLDRIAFACFRSPEADTGVVRSTGA